MYKFKYILWFFLIFFLIGCAVLSEKEIKARAALFELPEVASLDSTVIYFISPPGWYEPWDYYIIESKGISRKVNFGKYISITTPRNKSVKLKYRYGSDFSRGHQGNWVLKEIEADTKEVFLLRDGEQFILVSKKKAIAEILIMQEIFKEHQEPVYSEI